MMLLNHINDPLIEPVLKRQIDPLLHMRDDDQRAHRRSKVVVRIIVADDIFREIVRLYQLADIMKVSARTAHGTVGSYLVCSHFSQIRHYVAVVPGTRASRLSRSRRG